MKLLLNLLFILCSGIISAQNQAPEISNLSVNLTSDETLTVSYDLFDLENDDVTVSLHVRSSEGITFNIETQNATGDIDQVTPGTGKSIVWNFEGLLPSSGDYTVKLVAEDQAEIDIQSIVNQVDSVNLRADLELIEGIRHRTAGPDLLQETRDLIAQRFTEYGLIAEIEDVEYNLYTGENHVGTKTGTTDDEFIYICDAHYDTVDDAPGADDNGSGVVGFLEAARILSEYNFRKTIKFIGFDLEEAGLIGSLDYVDENISPEENMEGVLNFEMIGYYSDEPNSQSFPAGFELLFPSQLAEIEADEYRGNFIGNIGLVNQEDWAMAYEDAATTYVPDLKVITFIAPSNWPLVAQDLGRSDHGPFWQADHPAVMLTGTAEFRNPNYHQPSDTVGTLNFEFMSNVVKAAVATLAEEAEIHNSTFAEETINLTANSIEELSPCSIAIVPNPVANILRFQTPDCSAAQSKLDIYNASGVLVHEQFIFDNSSEIRIHIKDWNSGTYLLSINKGEISERFVVRH